MKRRLRKKLHLGEFREDCFEVAFSVRPPHSPAEEDAFYDAFIGLIEDLGLQFGGGGGPEAWDGIVQLESNGTFAQERRERVIEWLNEAPRVGDLCAGPLRDAWYGWEG